MNITSNKLLKFYHLSVKDKLKFVVYSLMFNFFLFIFRLLGYKKSKKIINSIVNPSKNTEDIKEKNVENESIIIGYSTNNTLLNPTCLERSLFTYLILCLYGINCDLKIGINNSSNEFSAHAWIEYKNRVINDNNDQIKNFSTF